MATVEEKEITSVKPELTATELVVHNEGAFAMLFDTAMFNQAWRVAKAFSDSRLVPAHFQGNTAGVFVVLHMATRMELDPFMVLQKTYMVKGRPGMEAQLIIALVNARGPFEGPIQWEMSGEGDKRQCTAYAYHRETGEKCAMTVTWDMVKKERWQEKDGSKWLTLPDLMFRYRSAVFLARLYCPEVIMGLSTVDELEDMDQVIDITPEEKMVQIPQAEKIKEKLSKRSKAPQVAPEASPQPEVPVSEENPPQAAPEGGGGNAPTRQELIGILEGKGMSLSQIEAKLGKRIQYWGDEELKKLADMAAE